MTIERDTDQDATLKMPLPPQLDSDLEDVDPEKTLVREEWERGTAKQGASRSS
jgi:hypothetical protein